MRFYGIVTAVSVVLAALVMVVVSQADFWAERKRVMEKEDRESIGSQLELTEQEKCVSDILMELKLKEWNTGFQNPKLFHPSRHFFDTNNFIEQSTIYNFLKNLPKGALLHTHFYGMVSSEFIYNLTHSEDLYACYADDQMLLHFFYDHIDNRCDWVPVKALRRLDKAFDKKLKSHAFMAKIAEGIPFDDQSDAKSAFLQAHEVIVGLITYKPTFYKYFYRALEELFEERIMYVEFRSQVLPVYDLEGNIYEAFDVIQMLQEIVEEFKCNNVGFLGAKLIYTTSELVTDEPETLEQGLHRTLSIAKYYPNFIAGYDVMRREELDKPLAEVVATIQNVKDLKFFFHAGASNWIGAMPDMNLLDAILMNTYRIGHGFGLIKHPALLSLVRERSIPIEICPLSNQVFGLITDLRNHPATYFISHGYPVVVCNDDPGMWNAKGVTYDWYMLFMGMANVRSDLRLLKQLAINSIMYSAMDDREMGLVAFAKVWDTFIESVPRCRRGEPQSDELIVPKDKDILDYGSGMKDYEEETFDYGDDGPTIEEIIPENIIAAYKEYIKNHDPDLYERLYPDEFITDPPPEVHTDGGIIQQQIPSYEEFQEDRLDTSYDETEETSDREGEGQVEGSGEGEEQVEGASEQQETDYREGDYEETIINSLEGSADGSEENSGEEFDEIEQIEDTASEESETNPPNNIGNESTLLSTDVNTGTTGVPHNGETGATTGAADASSSEPSGEGATSVASTGTPSALEASAGTGSDSAPPDGEASSPDPTGTNAESAKTPAGEASPSAGDAATTEASTGDAAASAAPAGEPAAAEAPTGDASASPAPEGDAAAAAAATPEGAAVTAAPEGATAAPVGEAVAAPAGEATAAPAGETTAAPTGDAVGAPAATK